MAPRAHEAPAAQTPIQVGSAPASSGYRTKRLGLMRTEPTATTIERIAWMFPGEGSHRPLMARRLTGSRALLDQARSVCGAELYRLCAVDRAPWWPEEAAQLAIFVTSLAAARALECAGLGADGAVGHGLGELAALVAAGALSFPDALEAVHTRAKAMSSVGRRHGGGMVTVAGLSPEEVQAVCAGLPGVWVAGYNSPLEVAVSGDEAALGAAAVRLRKAGARVIRIEAPYARHSSSMAPVRDHLADLLQGCPIGDPQLAFYSTVDAGPHADGEA